MNFWHRTHAQRWIFIPGREQERACAPPVEQVLGLGYEVQGRDVVVFAGQGEVLSAIRYAAFEACAELPVAVKPLAPSRQVRTAVPAGTAHLAPVVQRLPVDFASQTSPADWGNPGPALALILRKIADDLLDGWIVLGCLPGSFEGFMGSFRIIAAQSVHPGAAHVGIKLLRPVNPEDLEPVLDQS